MFVSVRRTALSLIAAAGLVLSGIAGFEAAPAHAAPTFTDVPASHPFRPDISWIAAQGITKGYSDGSFHPQDSVTRAAYAAFLYRMSNEPAFTLPKTSPFVDVPTTHRFYKEIAWLSSIKVTKGWPDQTFRPEEKITRDAMAAFMYRYACEPPYTLPKDPIFNDVAPSRVFYKEISWMNSSGLSMGRSDRTYRPMNNTECGAIAAFLHRYADTTLPKAPNCSPAATAKAESITENRDVTFADQSGTKSDTFTIPNVPGIIYSIDGKDVAAGTYPVRPMGRRKHPHPHPPTPSTHHSKPNTTNNPNKLQKHQHTIVLHGSCKGFSVIWRSDSCLGIG